MVDMNPGRNGNKKPGYLLWFPRHWANLNDFVPLLFLLFLNRERSRVGKIKIAVRSFMSVPTTRSTFQD